jgi:hypothetical protein
MAGVSICCALADSSTTWFHPIGHKSSSQILGLACMVYSCCPCPPAADALINTGQLFWSFLFDASCTYICFRAALVCGWSAVLLLPSSAATRAPAPSHLCPLPFSPVPPYPSHLCPLTLLTSVPHSSRCCPLPRRLQVCERAWLRHRQNLTAALAHLSNTATFQIVSLDSTPTLNTNTLCHAASRIPR